MHQILRAQFHVVSSLNVGSFKNLPLASFFSDFTFFPKAFFTLPREVEEEDKYASFWG